MDMYKCDEFLTQLVETLGPQRVEELRKEIHTANAGNNRFSQLREIWAYDRLIERLPPLTLTDFINAPIPACWDKWSLGRRLRWWKGVDVPQSLMGTIKRRDRVCAVEVWCELYKQPMKLYNQQHARTINAQLAELPGLFQPAHNIRCGPYGRQRGFYIIPPDEPSKNGQHI